MADAEKIKAALAGLDPANDDVWTSSGQPLVDTIRKAIGDDTITRQDITNADPAFSREALKAAKVAAVEQATKAAAQDDADKPELLGDGVDPTAPLGKAEEHVVQPTAIELAQKAVKDKQKALADAQAQLNAALREQDKVIEAAEKGRDKPHVENMKGIQVFIASQTAERAARAGVAHELRKHGITPALLTPGSKLDQAMARKRGFGLNRPNLPHRG